MTPMPTLSLCPACDREVTPVLMRNSWHCPDCRGECVVFTAAQIDAFVRAGWPEETTSR